MRARRREQAVTIGAAPLPTSVNLAPSMPAATPSTTRYRSAGALLVPPAVTLAFPTGRFPHVPLRPVPAPGSVKIPGTPGAPPKAPVARFLTTQTITPPSQPLPGDVELPAGIPGIKAGTTLQDLSYGVDLSQGTSSLTDLASMDGISDSTLLQSLGGQATSLLATTQIGSDAEAIWQGAVAGMKEGLAIGATVLAVDIVLNELGFTLLASILEDLVNAIAIAIAQALVEVGVADIAAATAAGGTFGYVGAIIGAIIGACIALGNLLYGGQHLTINDGRSFSCKDYMTTNIPGATKWLNDNQDKLVGLTPLRFAKQAAIFVANPWWVYDNQALLGVSVEKPPDPGSGDPLDIVCTQVPGAFELLNRAQYLQAVTFVNTCPQHIAEVMGIPKPVPSQTNGSARYGVPQHGQGVYPTGDVSKYQPIASGGQSATGAINATASWAPGIKEGPISLPNGGTSDNSFRYGACPNLFTNDNTYSGTWKDGQGKISGQTDISPGIYALQYMFPALTSLQCEMIFAACSQTFGPVPDLSGSTVPGTPPPVPSVFAGQGGQPGGYTGDWTIGPGSLTGLTLGSLSSGLATLNGSAIGAWYAQQAAQGKSTVPPTPPPYTGPNWLTNPPKIVVGGAPVPPTLTLAAAQGAPPSYVAGTIQSAASGNPLGIANTAVLTLAQKLETQAHYVARFVSEAAADAIITGAHLAT